MAAAKPDDDYDPYEHRDVKKPTSDFGFLMNLLKGCLGTGILAMPVSFEYSGLMFGIPSVIFISFVVTYCVHNLINSSYILCKKHKVPYLSYSEMYAKAIEDGPNCVKRCGKHSGHLININLLIYQIGVCCIYTLFISKNIQFVISYAQNLTAKDKEFNVQYIILMMIVPLVLISLIDNTKILAPFSTVGNVLALASFAIILYYLFTDLGPISERRYSPTYLYPLHFGIAMFSISPVGFIMPLARDMKNPQKFGGWCGLLNIAITLVVILYIVIAFFGYWRYGDDTKGNVALNLPLHEIPPVVCQVMYALAVYISFALNFYVAIDLLWTEYAHTKVTTSKYHKFYKFLIKCGLILLLSGAVMAIPMLSHIISLIGSFSLSLLGIIFPSIVDMSVHWYKGPKNIKGTLCKDVLLIIFGIIGLICGSSVTIYDIIKEFKTT